MNKPQVITDSHSLEKICSSRTTFHILMIKLSVTPSAYFRYESLTILIIPGGVK